jgi:predicted amidophosphoribosyltransferase
MVLPSGARCERCGIPLVSERGTCLRCRGTEYAFTSSFALFPHRDQVKTLIRALKFEGRGRCADLFAQWAADALHGRYPELPVVPVPPRKARRGEDPVGRIARRLEKHHGITVLPILERTGGAQQKSLDYAERRDNLRGRIRLKPGVRQVPEGAVVLDDVFTTGATLDACARALQDAGCREVFGLTLVIEE